MGIRRSLPRLQWPGPVHQRPRPVGRSSPEPAAETRAGKLERLRVGQGKKKHITPIHFYSVLISVDQRLSDVGLPLPTRAAVPRSPAELREK